ncbi:MAG TPA: nickel insertion protein, partial [Candidatus Udaeobacter sp.]|nr:nickel insertion protein [Candidatus Udaeobacter sp.]
MRALYLDPVGGAAGDMILAALIDAGAPADEIRRALHTLPLPPDSFVLEVRRIVAGGLEATQLAVEVREPARS